MKRNLAVIFMINVIIACWTSYSFGGAWTAKKGTSYNKLAANYYHSDENYIEDSDRLGFPNNGEFQEYNLNYYGEYGLTDQLTLIGSFYYKKISYEDDNIELDTWGMGDVDLALKYKLLEGSIGILSAQGLVKIPELYDEDDDLPLGNGQYDYELRILYGRSLRPILPGYYNSEIGYRWRAEEPSDEFRFLAEFGMDFGKRFYGRVKLDGLLGIDDGEKSADSSGNPTISNDFDLIKLDIALGYKMTKHWGLEAAYTPSIYGQNTAAGATYTLALILQTW
jgi:protein XagA